jgi:fructose-bisphosphate aldolase class II
MSIVTGAEILDAAKKGNYGVGAFNTHNLEITQGIIAAAEKKKSPIIIAMSEGAIRYGGKILPEIVRTLGERASVPVAIHLDHGASFEVCMLAIQNGFTSVMIDKSHESEFINIEETKRVVDLAHSLGVSVEAEIGRLGGIEEHVIVSKEQAVFTEVSEAIRFYEQTGIDSLAIAVGTSHGPNKGTGTPFIHHERIKEISQALNIPLVLHGASSVPLRLVDRINNAGGNLKNAVGINNEDIKKGIMSGICKINTETDLRLAFYASVREVLRDYPSEIDPRKALKPAREEIEKMVCERIDVFNSANKA